MRRFRACAMPLLASVLVASACGCARQEDESPPNSQASSASSDEVAGPSSQGKRNGSSVPPAPAKGILFDDVLASWESGKKDEAVEQLLSIRWAGPDVFADMPMMNLSEQGFASLPRDERTRIQKELIELVGTLRALVRHAVAAGDDAQASGDKQTAKAHYQAVLNLGQAVSSPQRTLLIQQVGKTIATVGREKLSALK